jgi:predicted ATP-grasp superfamily ATP-dependent carboligase
MFTQKERKTLSKPQKTLHNLFLRYKANALNRLFVIPKKIKLKKSFSKPFHILFSKKEIWDGIISESFNNTQIKVSFEEFSHSDFSKYDLVVPLIVQDILICIEKKHELENQLIPIPSLEAFNICNNKLEFSKILKENNLMDYVPKTGSDIVYPYILKKETGEYGATTYVVNNAVEELKYAELLNDGLHFKQELVTGNKEYASHIVFKNGKIVSHIRICYTYDREQYIQGKVIYVSKGVCKPKFDAEFTKVLEAIKYEGLCCIDYKVKDGLPKIFEINPRFGGSLTNYFFSLLNEVKSN